MPIRRLVKQDDVSPGTTLGARLVVIPVPDMNSAVLNYATGGKGLAADSTGVQYTSLYKFKWDKKNLKEVRIRASWTASNTDSVEKIAVQDDTTKNDVVAVSGNNGTDVEQSQTDLSNVTDGGLATVYTEVTTASATTGATYNISYVVIELLYGP